MAETSSGPAMVLIAGTLTFGNEFVQANEFNVKVIAATLLGAWFMMGVAKVSPKGATALGFMVLLAAAATPVKGKSPFQELASVTKKAGLK